VSLGRASMVACVTRALCPRLPTSVIAVPRLAVTTASMSTLHSAPTTTSACVTPPDVSATTHEDRSVCTAVPASLPSCVNIDIEPVNIQYSLDT